VGHQVNVTSARFLQKDPEIRLPKKFTSVVVSVPTDEVDKITPSVLIHGCYKASAVMWHSNTTKQCKKCYQFGHPEGGCKATHHTCPICGCEYRLKEHKWGRPRLAPGRAIGRSSQIVALLPRPSVQLVAGTTRRTPWNALLKSRLNRTPKNITTEGEPTNLLRVWT